MRFSIVTPVLNRVSTIRDCVESVARQSGDAEELQHVVIDGGSNDGTLEVLASYPHIEVIHEPHPGIYVAINRGLSAARHGVVGIVNSDDLLESETLAAVSALFREHPDVEIVAGRGIVERLEGDVRRLVRHVPRRGHLGQSWDLFFHGSTAINARFFRRCVFERLGAFNVEYPICADRELLIRMKLAGVATLPVDQVFYRYLEHEGSATLNAGRRYDLRMRGEHIAIAENYLSSGRLSRSQSKRFQDWVASERARNAVAMVKGGALSQAWQEARTGLKTSAGGFVGFLLRRAIAAAVAATGRRW